MDDVMEPFSNVAAILQVSGTAGKLFISLSRFVIQTISIRDSISELKDEVQRLNEALDCVGQTFRRRPRPLPFEQKHHDAINRIVLSCHNSLKKLDKALPQLRDKSTPLDTLRLSLQKSLADEQVKELIRHIASYRGILHLSLSTLSLSELWINRHSQELILEELRRLKQALTDAGLFSSAREAKTRELEVMSLSSIPESPMDEEEPASALEKEIREWRDTVEDVAAVVSHYTPDDDSIRSYVSIPMHDQQSISTSHTLVDDISESEYQVADEIDRRHMQRTLENNQKIVSNLRENKIYFQAARFQRRAIKLCGVLNAEPVAEREGHDDFHNDIKLADMKELLADILYESKSRQEDDIGEVEEILKELLSSEKEAVETDDPDRQWRLHHKLGVLYAEQGKSSQSRGHLRQAVWGRLRATPQHKSLVVESVQLLVKNLQSIHVLDEALALQDLLAEEFAEEFSIDSDPAHRQPAASVSAMFEWSEQLGFGTDNPLFKFDVCDPKKGKAPIHQAIEDGNLEMVHGMLSSSGVTKRTDVTGQTLLHLAASACDERICALLLEKGADVDVEDEQRQTPLHKCQSGSGGVGVAKLFLDRSGPDFIDRLDCFGKTALYMACEKSNKEMVSFLLSREAKPNIRGPNQSTPLIRAIETAPSNVIIHLVKELLRYGANPRLRDMYGTDAFKAAKEAGLAAGEIRRLLSESTARRPSSTSTASSSSYSGRASSVYTSSETHVSDSSENTRLGGKRLFSWFVPRSS
ncbi:ankyrin [Poronia punctata]|nr:ankyrin [Poronia punctata]